MRDDDGRTRSEIESVTVSDREVFERADAVIEKLRQERTVNNWRDRVAAAFRETKRGAA